MTFERDDDRRRISVRANESLHDAVERLAEEQGVSKSEFVRDVLWDEVSDQNPDVPADKELRDAYLWLRGKADDFDRVPADLALSKLAQKYQIDKRFVKRLHLKPLQRRGWIVPKNGVIRVQKRDDGDNHGSPATVSHE